MKICHTNQDERRHYTTSTRHRTPLRKGGQSVSQDNLQTFLFQNNDLVKLKFWQKHSTSS